MTTAAATASVVPTVSIRIRTKTGQFLIPLTRPRPDVYKAIARSRISRVPSTARGVKASRRCGRDVLLRIDAIERIFLVLDKRVPG
jgi:hypothetical protein